MQTSHNHILKIYNPIVSSVRTYRAKNTSVKIGSSEDCDLQIYLPSLLPIHIVVNFEDRKIAAMGNDVYCDTVPIIQGTTLQFSNDSIVRIHNIFMMFLSLESVENVEKYDDRILAASSRFKEYAPILKIAHKDSTMSSDINRDIKPESFDINQVSSSMKELTNNNSVLLADSYKKELGEFSEMPHIAPSNMIDDNTVIKKVIEETEEEFKKEYNTAPSPTMLEAAIQKKIDVIDQEVKEILENDPNIHISKPHRPDLGAIAIENDVLMQAEAAIDRSIADKVLEAEINSLEQLKNNITDNIKEEISQMIQEETREQVERAIKEQLPMIMEYNNSQFVEEDVSKRIKPNGTVEDEKQASDRVENDSEDVSMTKAIEGPISVPVTVEDKSVENKPVKDKPVEDKFVENKSEKDKLEKDKLEKDKSEKDKPEKKAAKDTAKPAKKNTRKTQEKSKKETKPKKKAPKKETKKDTVKETKKKDEKQSEKEADQKEASTRKRPTRKAATKNKQ